MPVKVNKIDKIFSLLVRERVNYNCDNCGNNFRNGGLDCSHNVPRRHVATKWHPDCARAHCRSCHRIFTDNPIQHTRWLEEHYGVAMVDEMHLIAHTPVKWTKKMREEIYKHLQSEYKSMLEMRAKGATYEINFARHEYMHQFSGGWLT